MSNQRIFRKTNVTAFGVGIFSCAVCCALPLIAATVGSASLLAAAPYVDKVGRIFILIAIGFTVYFWWQSRKPKSCATNCACKIQTSGE